MDGSDKAFRAKFGEILAPKLRGLGFTEAMIKGGWMHPEFLYRRGGTWFGCSWDHRDSVLEMSLGKLHSYRDVMPRLIVLGYYDHYLKAKGIKPPAVGDYNDISDYFETRFLQVESSIDGVLGDFDRYWGGFRQSLASGEGDKRYRKSVRQFLANLGPELTEAEIPYEGA